MSCALCLQLFNFCFQLSKTKIAIHSILKLHSWYKHRFTLFKLEIVVSSRIASLLLFEPDRATRQLYARELGKRWRVIAAEQASEVLSILATERIEAIILEPGAVDAEQWHILAQIRQQAECAAMPIIICSSVDARSKGYALGVSAYLVKPVSPHQLSNEVARWLNGQFKTAESR